MKEVLLLFLSTNDERNVAAYNMLRRLDNQEVRVVADGAILDGYVQLPFLQTSEGARFFGLDSIQSYVEEQLAAV